MFLASFLIGLREGMEAALTIGILIAFVRRQQRQDLTGKIWSGVTIAVVGSLVVGAVLTFGAYGLSFRGQEIIGGTLSLIAVAMVTWMVLWMVRMGGTIKGDLEGRAGSALARGQGRALFWIALVSVGREGIETTLMLWGWALQPLALVGAIAGITVAAALGYLLFAGLVRINLSTFFTWSGSFLIIVAAGILAYGIHDLQEAAMLPGPYSGHPITPTDLRTGEVLVGPTDGPFWMASFPFGWAFDLTDTIDPSGWVATFAKGTIGFAPLMSWLEVLAWATYLAVVVPLFVRRVREARSRRRPSAPKATANGEAQPTETAQAAQVGEGPTPPPTAEAGEQEATNAPRKDTQCVA